MGDIDGKVRQLMEELGPKIIEDFHWLHENPELSFQEHDTTAFLRKEIEDLGIEILDSGLETGFIALLKGSCDGPCIALRADIDGLPVLEESTSTHPSKRTGQMHACGHDTHCGSLLGAARILARMKDQIHGSVKFLFQPAEEVNLGAKKLMSLNCLENPKVDAIFGLHNSPEIPLGTIAVKNGALMASVDRINITITGKGGHGGVPQRNFDPIVAAAAVIQAAQTIVSRNVSPIDSCVVSICNVRAGEGTTNNVCPDTVKMYGTIRCYKEETQHLVERRLNSILQNICEAYECTGELEYIYELPVTANNPSLFEAADSAVRGAGVQPVDPIPSTGGEDFSIYLQTGVPGFFYWLGTRNEENDCVYSWHSPHFKADDRCIPIGAGVYAMSVFEGIRAIENQKAQQ